jgi:hypothetical protein
LKNFETKIRVIEYHFSKICGPSGEETIKTISGCSKLVKKTVGIDWGSVWVLSGMYECREY